MIIWIFGFLLLQFLFMHRCPVPKGVVLYFANIGAGKSTLLSKLSYQMNRQKLSNKIGSRLFPKYIKPRTIGGFDRIICNAQIDGTTYVPKWRDLAKYCAVEKCLILIDEGSIEYNNRNSMSKNLSLTYEEIQNLKLIRHYQSTIVIVSQSYEDIDVTLRRLYTHIYLLEYWLFGFTVIKRIKKKIGIDELSGQIMEQYHFQFPLFWRLLYRPKYFKLFNSWWIPADFPIMNFDDPVLLKKYQVTDMPKINYKKGLKGFVSHNKLLAYFNQKGGLPAGSEQEHSNPTTETSGSVQELLSVTIESSIN